MQVILSQCSVKLNLLKKKKKRGEGADNVGNSSLCIFAPSGKDEVTRKTLTLSLNN